MATSAIKEFKKRIMGQKDYYKILGVNKNATQDEIKSAYRNLAKKWHPDVYANDTEEKKEQAKEKFQEIQHAYSVLSDADKKAKYDQFGSEDGPQFDPNQGFSGGFGGFGGFADIFGDIFSSFGGGHQNSPNAPRMGEDIEFIINLSFEEAAFGISKEIKFSRIENCASCKGTGAKNGTAFKTCTKCAGKGRITVDQRTMLGVMRTEKICDMCNGTGKIITEQCGVCSGRGRIKKQRSINVNIPAGVDNNQMLTVRGEGNAGINGGENGNLILIFKVSVHKLFRREGINLFMDLPIKVSLAILGGTVEIPTLTKRVKINVPAGTQDGVRLKVKGYGIKDLRRNTYGDLYINLKVDIPKNLNNKQKKALKDALEVLDSAKYDNVEKYKSIENSISQK